MTEFKTLKLSEVCEVATGNSAPQGEIYFEKGKYPFIRVKHISKSKQGYIQDCDLINQKAIEDKKLKKYPKDSIVFAKSGMSIHLNVKGRLKEDSYVVSHLAILIPKKDFVDPQYLYYWSKSYKFSNLSRGSTLPSIKTSDIKNLNIKVPSLSDQKKIVSVLERAEKLKEKREEADELTKDYLKSVFNEMFFKKKFEIKKLKEVCEKITDGTHHTPRYTSEGIPFLRVTDITGSNSSKKFISKEEHGGLIKRCNPKKGDILYTKNGTIGIAKTIDWDYEFSIFVSLCLIKPKRDIINSRYLASFLNTDYARSQAAAGSKIATIKNFHLVEIKKIKIPVPPLSLQNKFAEIVKQVESMKGQQKQSKEQTDHLFNALMQKAFKGELTC